MALPWNVQEPKQTKMNILLLGQTELHLADLVIKGEPSDVYKMDE